MNNSVSDFSCLWRSPSPAALLECTRGRALGARLLQPITLGCRLPPPPPPPPPRLPGLWDPPRSRSQSCGRSCGLRVRGLAGSFQKWGPRTGGLEPGATAPLSLLRLRELALGASEAAAAAAGAGQRGRPLAATPPSPTLPGPAPSPARAWSDRERSQRG